MAYIKINYKMKVWQVPERAKASILAVVGLLTDTEKNLNLSPGPELRTDPW